MTTLREDLEDQESCLAFEQDFVDWLDKKKKPSEASQDKDLSEDKELQEYIKRETAKMEENQNMERAEPIEWEQKHEIKLVEGISNNRKRIIPEVHFTTKDIPEPSPIDYVSPRSVIGKMLEKNKKSKVEKVKAGFTKTPRSRVRTKRKWNVYPKVKYH